MAPLAVSFEFIFICIWISNHSVRLSICKCRWAIHAPSCSFFVSLFVCLLVCLLVEHLSSCCPVTHVRHDIIVFWNYLESPKHWKTQRTHTHTHTLLYTQAQADTLTHSYTTHSSFWGPQMTSLGFDNKLICAALRCLFSPLSLFLFACGLFRCLSSLFMNMQLVCKLKCYAALVLLYLLLTLNDFKYEYSISMFVTAAPLLCAFFVVGPKPNLWGPPSLLILLLLPSP